MLLTYAEYTAIYGTGLEETSFNRFLYDAEAELHRQTTGIDGYDKIENAMPTKEGDVLAIKRCLMALVDAFARIQAAEDRSASYSGNVSGGAIKSQSSGSESVTYDTGSSASALGAAISSVVGRRTYISNIIKRYLAGHGDKNGVNLLYMGAYNV